MGKTLEKEEKEREGLGCVYVCLLGVAPQTEDRYVASLFWECLFICPSRDVRALGQTPRRAVYSQSGGTQETANGSFQGKNARGDPRGSIGGNESYGRGPDGDHFQPRGPEVEPHTGNMSFYIYVTCTLRYLAYQECLSTIKKNVKGWPRFQSRNGKSEWFTA